MTLSIKLEKHFASLPTSFASEEERFLFLKSIEDVVQQKYATEREREIFRKSLIRLHPKIFKTPFADYQLSQERKKELLNIIDASAQSIAFNKDICNQILNFTSLDFENKKNLLQNIAVYMIRDSGVTPFQTGTPNVELNIEDMEDNLAGYATNQTKNSFTEDAIYINKKQVEKASSIHELLNIFFHEALHTRQTQNQNTFTGLSHLYYVSSGKDMNEWKKQDLYRTYLGQPIEKEAWFLGTQVQNLLVKKIKENVLTQEFTRLAHILTGQTHSPDEVTFKKYRSNIEVDFKHPIDPDITNTFLNENDLPFQIDTSNYFASSKRVYISTIGDFAVQTPADIKTGIDWLSNDLIKANTQRKHFQNTLLKQFKDAPLIKKEKNKLTFQGNQENIIQYIRSFKSDMTARYNKETNETLVSLPLQLSQHMKPTTYMRLKQPQTNILPAYIQTTPKSTR